MRQVARVCTAVAVGIAAGCINPETLELAPGEVGDDRTYGMRLHFVDEATRKPLPKVQVTVYRDQKKTVYKGESDAQGRAFWQKLFSSRLMDHYDKPSDYPSRFVLIVKLKGYKTIKETVPVERFRDGVDERYGSRHHTIKMVRGRGTIKRTLVPTEKEKERAPKRRSRSGQPDGQRQLPKSMF